MREGIVIFRIIQEDRAMKKEIFSWVALENGGCHLAILQKAIQCRQRG
jgi:hypothetical protein